MKQFVVQIVALVAIILVGVYLSTNIDILSSYLTPFVKPSVTTQSPQVSAGEKIKVGSAIFSVDIADTDEKRAKGFSGVDSIPQNYGLLFVFDKTAIRTFWMKGVKFPLDLIWIKGDTVVDITPNVQPPAPGQPDNLLPRYKSKEPVDRVLEVLGGTATTSNIKIGDKVTSAN